MPATTNDMIERTADGVGAVNSRGQVLLFVLSQDWSDFSSFGVEGERIDLASTDGVYSRRYGPLCVQTSKRSGTVLVQEILDGGRPGRILSVEVSRGR